jgi:urease accessory protein
MVAGVGAMAVMGLASSAFAHAGHSDGTAGGSFAAGITHPVFGLDHLLAAVTSGLLAVRVGSKKAMWVVPAAFVALMIIGGVIGAMGPALSSTKPVEWTISASVIVLGLMVAAMPKVPLWVAGTLVGIFALAHGHAHGAELDGNILMPYVIGFAIATALLHAGAIAIGMGMVKLKKPVLVRVAGGAIAMAFAVMMMV